MKNRIFDWARALAGAALLTFILKTVAFATYYIPSESMVPTLEVGDRLIATKFDYGYGPYSAPLLSLPAFPSKDGRLFGSLPERGDIVLFRHPVTGETLIKRVIGLPGDRIQITRGRLIINGEVMPRRKVKTYAYKQYAGPPVTVTEYEETLPGGRVHPIIMRSDAAPQENTGTYVVPPGAPLHDGRQPRQFRRQPLRRAGLRAGREPDRPLAPDPLFAARLPEAAGARLRPAPLPHRPRLSVAGRPQPPRPKAASAAMLTMSESFDASETICTGLSRPTSSGPITVEPPSSCTILVEIEAE